MKSVSFEIDSAMTFELFLSLYVSTTLLRLLKGFADSSKCWHGQGQPTRCDGQKFHRIARWNEQQSFEKENPSTDVLDRSINLQSARTVRTSKCINSKRLRHPDITQSFQLFPIIKGTVETNGKNWKQRSLNVSNHLRFAAGLVLKR